jgi:hypothetical protein
MHGGVSIMILRPVPRGTGVVVGAGVGDTQMTGAAK